VIIGGGSPKNLCSDRTPDPVLDLDEGRDYYLQFTDARPDTGGLSGAA
jgi:deoxyhypusine synthase